jgi:hypothetical protein
MSTLQKYGCLLLIFSLAACRKNNEGLPTFELTYNGVTSSLTPMQWSFNNNLSIHGHTGTPFDLFEMQKNYTANYCAAVIKTGCCEFQFQGFTDDINGCVADVRNSQQEKLDSTKLYTYKDGSLSYKELNCEISRTVDLFTGNPGTSKFCDVSGTLTLTASNGAGEEIKVSGTFNQYNVRR